LSLRDLPRLAKKLDSHQNFLARSAKPNSIEIVQTPGLITAMWAKNRN
jgi:hypothetical protein